MISERMLEFVWLPTFERTSKKLLNEEDRRLIEMEFCGEGELLRCQR